MKHNLGKQTKLSQLTSVRLKSEKRRMNKIDVKPGN
jgi:hypothetical protein